MIIKELNQNLIQQANSSSFNGTRGDSSAYEYKLYANKILELPVSDEKKQKLLDTLYEKWSNLLRYEAQHVSVMYAGPAKYNAKKLDKSDQILKLSSEIVEWVKSLQEQAKDGTNSYSKVELLVKNIEWSEGKFADEWAKLVELDKQKFKELYEKFDKVKPFRKNSTAYKLYHNLDNIVEKKKEIFCDSADYTAYTEGDRAYIRFTLRPKRQLIVALKSRGWWWNSNENAWSTYLNKLDKEWVSSIGEKYSKYI